jgi:Ca-activated chloride channel family protein
MVGKDKQQFDYELNFPAKTESDTGKDFVEPLWARRKVGYLLDQIRVNGEKDELIKEVVALAKRYGIATPYTSYLVVPDGPMPVLPPRPGPGGPGPRPPVVVPLAPPVTGGTGGPTAGGGFGPAPVPPGIPMGANGKPGRVEDFAKEKAGDKNDPKGGLAGNRGAMTEKQVKEAIDQLKAEKDPALRAKLMEDVKRYAEQKKTWDEANAKFKGGKDGYQTGQLGVDLSCAANQLRNQDRVSLTANRNVYGRNCLEIGGVWIDDAYKSDTKSVTVKAQSDAYFRILELNPTIKDVYRLGNFVVWITPSGTALVIDQNDGKEKMDDADIKALFVKK